MISMRRTTLVLSLVFLLSTAVSAQSYESQNVDTAILASTENYPDALLSSAPAEKLGVPVLLTEKEELPSEASDTMEELGVENVIMVGGPTVISEEVESQVESQVSNVTRLWGTTQVGTSVEVSEYFWSEGAEEVTIVQYPHYDGDYWENYGIMAALSDSTGEHPILISQDGVLSAEALSEVERLEVDTANVYSTRAVNVTQDLEDTGVNQVNLLEADHERLRERLRNMSRDRLQQVELDSNSTLLIVAASDFRDPLSAPSHPNSHVMMVRSEDGIEEAVSTAEDTGAGTIKVVGKPDLAQQIADSIESETGRTVDFVSGQNSAQVAAEAVRKQKQDWGRMHERKFPAWRQKVNEAPGLEKAANRTMARARNLIDQNSSEETRQLLLKAQKAYRAGDYYRSRKMAQEAHSQARVERFRHMDQEEIQEQAREERQSFSEAAREMGEISQEMSRELREAETVEEKKEILEEYREKRREAVQEMRQEQRENREQFRDKLGERFEKKDSDAGSSEIELEIEGSVVKAEADYVGRTAGYRTSKDVTVDNDNVEFRFEFTSPDEPAAQVITGYEAELEKQLEDGDYTISLELVVDGDTVDSISREVKVPSFQEYSSEKEQEDGETEEGMEEELNRTGKDYSGPGAEED